MREATLRFALCIFTVLLGSSGSDGGMAACVPGPETAGQPWPTGTSELVRLSDFVGFIKASPLVARTGAAWRQGIAVYAVDPLKGDLGPGAGTNRYPYISADHSDFTGYPTWFARTSEHLVFLRRESVDGKVVWVTTAVVGIEYRPDSAGSVVGRLYDEGQDRRAMSIGEVRTLLAGILSGERISSDAELMLDQLLSAAALSQASPLAREPATFEQRFAQVRALADAIRMGTRRADVEKVFPVRDGGLSARSSSRYYAGSEVKVEVPFDQEGGARTADNRVTGPLSVYRGRMHID